MRTIRLWNAEGVLAIILCPSGVTYTNQTCGTFCLQPSAEGVLAPFNVDNLPEEFERSTRRSIAAHGLARELGLRRSGRAPRRADRWFWILQSRAHLVEQ